MTNFEQKKLTVLRDFSGDIIGVEDNLQGEVRFFFLKRKRGKIWKFRDLDWLSTVGGA